jgi:hypothetical protein
MLVGPSIARRSVGTTAFSSSSAASALWELIIDLYDTCGQCVRPITHHDSSNGRYRTRKSISVRGRGRLQLGHAFSCDVRLLIGVWVLGDLPLVFSGAFNVDGSASRNCFAIGFPTDSNEIMVLQSKYTRRLAPIWCGNEALSEHITKASVTRWMTVTNLEVTLKPHTLATHDLLKMCADLAVDLLDRALQLHVIHNSYDTYKVQSVTPPSKSTFSAEMYSRWRICCSPASNVAVR